MQSVGIVDEHNNGEFLKIKLKSNILLKYPTRPNFNLTIHINIEMNNDSSIWEFMENEWNSWLIDSARLIFTVLEIPEIHKNVVEMQTKKMVE